MAGGVERHDVIEEAPLPDWELDGPPVVVDGENRDELAEAMEDAIGLLRRVGGNVQIGAIREQLPVQVRKAGGGEPEPLFVTRGYMFKWNSYMPPLKPQAGANGNGAESEQAEPQAD